jgi:iron complex outermembrane recepter protein
MKKFSLFVISLVLCSSSFSQVRLQLRGSVTDAQTGSLLRGATVSLIDAKITTITDTNGVYTFRNIPYGHTMIEISHVGYRTIIDHLDATGNTEKNFSLLPTVIENEAVTVTAVGSPISMRKAPVSITRISKSDLLAGASTNVIDALTRYPGISQVSTGPSISKPVIRGLGYNRLIVINDGIRQEGQQWGDEHGIEIDEHSVNRIEIVKGPASLIYGSDAIAGVINIITTVANPANTIQSNFFTAYQTNNRQRTIYGNIGGHQDAFNWNTWFDYKAAADYKNNSDGRVFNSKFNEHNYGGYAGFNGSWGYSRLIFSSINQNLGIIEGDRDAEGNFIRLLPGGVEEIPSTDDLNSTIPKIPYQHILHGKLISDNSFKAGKGKLSVILGYQRNQRIEYGNPDEPVEKELYFDLNTFNYNTIYQFAEWKAWTTSIGLNGMQQQNRNKGSEVLIPEYSLFDIGSFIYSQKTIGKTTMSGGLRYDKRFLQSNRFVDDGDVKFVDFEKTFSNFSGSVGLSYAVSKNSVLKVNIARGFRAPSIPELASNGAHEGTNRYEYGDQQLSSETSYQADAAIEINSDHALLSLLGFYNSINDFIFYSKLLNDNGTDSLVSADGDLIPAFKFGQHDGMLRGLEIKMDVHPHPLDWLHFESSFSFVRGTFKNEIGGTRNIPFIPAPRMINELRAELLNKGKRIRNLAVHIELDNTFEQKHPFSAYESETPTPSYALLNAGISGSIIRKNKILFSLYFTGSNLTDESYQTHLSRLKYAPLNPLNRRQGVFNTGRNFIIKLNVPVSFNTKIK